MNARKTSGLTGRTALLAAACTLALGTLAPAQRAATPPKAAPAAPAAGLTGLAGKLASDDALISEAANLELKSVLDYLFEKNKVPPEDRDGYLVIPALAELDNPKLTARQRQERLQRIAGGIARVIEVKKNPADLMKINNQLVTSGILKPVNLLEFFGETPKTQSQLRPIAEAVDRIYQQAYKLADEQSKALEAKMVNLAAQSQYAQQYERLENLKGLANYSRGVNSYPLAMSIDRADPKRAEAAKKGLEILAEYEDPEFKMQSSVRMTMAKLHMMIGDKAAVAEAKKKLDLVLKDKDAPWGMKFEAVYFKALADVSGRDAATAKKSRDEATKFLKDSPGPNAEATKGAEAMMQMLDFRINATEAELLGPEKGKAANDLALKALEELQKKRPDLTGVINEQMMARLPENPDLTKLPVLLLRALVARGQDEIYKREEEKLDIKAMDQGIAAAKQIVERQKAGKDGLTEDDADKTHIVMAAMLQRSGKKLQAAHAFLDHVEQYKEKERRKAAFDFAWSTVLEVRKEFPGEPTTAELWNRFLPIATAPPFEVEDFFSDYGRMLLQRNQDLMKGAFSDAQRSKMIADAKKAAELFKKIQNPRAKMLVRYYELLAYNQLLDIAGKDEKGEVKFWVARADALAKEVRSEADRLMSGGSDAEKKTARSLKVNTTLLAVGLATHDTTASRNETLQNAINMLANIEDEVKGLPGEVDLLSQALYMRIEYMMNLGKSEEALQSLSKYIETRGEESLQMLSRMIEELNTEFDLARNNNNTARMAELAGHQSTVSRFLVEQVSKSKNPKVAALLPDYRRFYANSLQKAAVLEKDEVKKRGYFDLALKTLTEDFNKLGNDPLDPDPEKALKQTSRLTKMELDMALLHFELGNYEKSQPIFLKLLDGKKLGKPMIEQEVAGETKLVYNEVYWEVNYKLLETNLEIAKKLQGGNAADAEKMKQDAILRLKNLFISFKEPGGPRWSPKLETMLRELDPTWTPPKEPASQPATQPG